jgi:Phage integrase, N-terminal SAM-like domain
MEGSPPRRDISRGAIWDSFLRAVRNRGVKPPIDRWYVIRAEQFAKTLGEGGPEACTAADVTRYLAELGRWGNLEDWQYRQVIDALETLLAAVLNLPWATGFDWGFWRDSAKGLQTAHPTIAREAMPAKGTPGGRMPCSRRWLLRSVAGGYSIRTEQVYVQWIRRFIAFCGHRDPRRIQAGEVKSFLER